MFHSKKDKNILNRIKFILIKYMNFKGGNVFIAKGSKISSFTQIGDFTRVNGSIVIKGKGRVKIGRLCAIGDGVRIITQNHDISQYLLSLNVQKKLLGKTYIHVEDVDISDNVWIGDNVIILPGVKIAQGAILAAGAIVTKDVNEFEVVGGNPAKVIKKRRLPNSHEQKSYDQIVEKLNGK